jgi:transcriptional regulator with PAS, ATPase and Fis domain
MSQHPWVDHFAAAVTVSDADGKIIEMNAKALETFAADGGAKLVGTNVLDCHPEPARTKLQEIMNSAQANVYTIEKRGTKKLIFQAPWFQDGRYAGHVELAFEIPWNIPHHQRD